MLNQSLYSAIMNRGLPRVPSFSPASSFVPADRVMRPTHAQPEYDSMGQEGRMVANPFPAPAMPNPNEQRMFSARDALRTAIQAQANIPAYQPPPPIMAPKPNLESMLLLGLLGALDPTKTVVPEFAGGYLQGGQLASQNEAIRRKEAIDAARAASQADIAGKRLDFETAADDLNYDRQLEAARLRAQQEGELLTQRQEFEGEQAGLDRASREKIEGMRSGGKDVSALLATLRNDKAPGEARATAAMALRSIDPARYPISDEQVEALRQSTPTQELQGAQAGLATERATDLKETRPARIAKLFAEGRGRDAHAEYEKSLTALKTIEAKYADQKHQAEIDKTQADTKAALARANNSLANAAKTRQTAGGKGMTDVQFRYFDKQLKAAESALGDLESSGAYLDERAAFYQSQTSSADPATAQAAQQALGEIGAQRAYLNNKIQRAKKLVTDLRSAQAPPNAQGGKVQVPNFLPFSKEINRRLGSFNPVNPVPPR